MGITKFVMDQHQGADALDELFTLKKNINSMRRTASNAGFSDYEGGRRSTTPGCSTSFWKASKYDRMTAAEGPELWSQARAGRWPPARLPPSMGMRAGQGLTIYAQRRLAKSGKGFPTPRKCLPVLSSPDRRRPADANSTAKVTQVQSPLMARRLGTGKSYPTPIYNIESFRHSRHVGRAADA